jgi:hypothetical protein
MMNRDNFGSYRFVITIKVVGLDTLKVELYWGILLIYSSKITEFL